MAAHRDAGHRSAAGRPAGRGSLLALAGLLLLLTGCGGSDGTSTSAAAGTAAPVDAEIARFRALASDVCTTVRQGVGGPTTAAPGGRSARASERVSDAMAVSLRRLPAPTSMRPQVDALADAYGEMRRTYAKVRRAGAGAARPGDAPAVDDLQRAITTRAVSVGLPACAADVR